jgi:DNA-binding winged helix-turn-helix (wHTH) protein
VDGELISRDELTATLFAINDIYVEVRSIRRLLEEDGDGEEAPADDA